MLSPFSAQGSNHVKRKMKERLRARKLDQHLADQFALGRLLACISSRPGQCGRCDGYILEGKVRGPGALGPVGARRCGW